MDQGSGVFHFKIDTYTGVLEGTHGDVVVRVTPVMPNGKELAGQIEQLSDPELSAIAAAESVRRPGEPDADYIGRLQSLVTWSQRHMIELLGARLGAPVIPRRVLERVTVPVAEP